MAIIINIFKQTENNIAHQFDLTRQSIVAWTTKTEIHGIWKINLIFTCDKISMT